MFSTHLDNFLPFLSSLKLSSANSFSLEESKICRLVMDLTVSDEASLTEINVRAYDTAEKDQTACIACMCRQLSG